MCCVVVKSVNKPLSAGLAQDFLMHYSEEVVGLQCGSGGLRLGLSGEKEETLIYN